MEAKRIELKILIASVGVILCVEGATRVTFSHSLAAVGGARLLETAILLCIVLFWGSGLVSIGLARSGIVRGLKRGLMWSVGFAVIGILIFLALLLAQINALNLLKTPLPVLPDELALFFLVGGVVAPVAEEVFFRGILYGFCRRWGFVMALVLSTMLFMLAHLTTQRIPLTQAVGGIVFAAAYEVEGSLLVPIMIHALGNIAIFTLSLVI